MLSVKTSLSSKSRLLAGLLVAALALTPVQPAMASTASFLAGLWPEAQAQGVSRRTFDAALGNFTPSQRILDLTKAQPEFTSTVADYINKRVTAGQVSTGRSMAGEWAQTLASVEARYGVSKEAVLAIWGMETSFGGFMGGSNTITALATLTYGGYRTEFFRKELLTALRILSDGHVAPSEMVGSWAGAMGHTQFMPSSFMAYAVDHNGDGRADIWKSVPDALASTANYLKQHGWRTGETWGYEVKLPRGFDFSRAYQIETATVSEWQAMGISRPSGRDFPRPTDRARLYLPAGGDGPAFLVLPNFDVIKRYNNSNSYALAVGHLADRIIGGGQFATNWPANDSSLTKSERQEVQILLARHGYDVGSPDGVIGPKSRNAIMAFQQKAGLTADGFASGRLLRSLR